MGLKLLKGYVKERYGHEVAEVPGGYAVYGKQLVNNKPVLFIQDFYVEPSERGLTTKSSPRQLFNLLKNVVKKDKLHGIMATVQLDSLNGNDVLKLFLYLGFKAVRGENTSILLTYETDKIKENNGS
tara:strand:+ start:30 stop:410 length:381 start_codon:yes stop_codon:yes gene_type:complete